MPKRRPNTPNLAQTVQKRRWTQNDAAEVVTAWRRSGLSQRVFCERHAIEIQRLARWAKQLPDRPALAEVVVVNNPTPSSSALARRSAPSSSANSAIVVEVGSARVVVEHDVDDDHLARVLQIVGAMC